jgi:predicted N-acetyltransferase YhbS
MALPFLVEPTQPADAPLIEGMLDQAFGLDRRVKTSYRLREGNTAAPGLSLVVRDAEVGLGGSISFWPLCIGPAGVPSLLLGPLVVHQARQNLGIGLTLMRQGLEVARRQGHRLVILVGDEPYYARVGFQRLPAGHLLLPGPVDPKRFLARELVGGALAQSQGLVLPPWRHAEISAALAVPHEARRQQQRG